MKVKMVVSVAGPGWSLSPGEETDRFTDREARKMVAAGLAIPVVAPKVERAVKRPVKETRDEE